MINIQKYMKAHDGNGLVRIPTVQDIDRALEQPAEANLSTLEYIQARPQLIEQINKLKSGDSPTQSDPT